MTLDQVRTGSEVEIVSIPQGSSHAELVRMGVCEGTQVTCRRTIPRGPVIVTCRRQEIAIGDRLARKIRVREGTT